jgi:hypothetical protein
MLSPSATPRSRSSGFGIMTPDEFPNFAHRRPHRKPPEYNFVITWALKTPRTNLHHGDDPPGANQTADRPAWGRGHRATQCGARTRDGSRGLVRGRT